MALLEVEELHTYYGNIHALKGISLVVEEGEVVTLIGANGAGKSTTLKTISALLRPRQGSVRLRGDELSQYPPPRCDGDGCGPCTGGPPRLRATFGAGKH
jgi:branched-chain amino acid transport system ATP-binding protein